MRWCIDRCSDVVMRRRVQEEAEGLGGPRGKGTALGRGMGEGKGQGGRMEGKEMHAWT